MLDQAAELSQKRQGIDILLAEDNDADAKIAKRAFKECKIKNNLYIVSDGQQVLDFIYHEGIFKDQKQYPQPDFILLDINMPIMSGLEVLQRIKGDLRFKKIPIGMLTSSQNSQDIEESYEQGACSYIPKPVHYEAFVEAINVFSMYWSVLNRLPQKIELTSIKSTSESTSPSQMPVTKKILIIDDDPQHLRIMSIVFNKAGFTDIVLADTGEKALEILAEVNPSVVILDTILPQKDGFEICLQIKKMRGNSTKVILNTSFVDAVNTRKAQAVGADVYLPKTLDSKNIVEAVCKLMESP